MWQDDNNDSSLQSYRIYYGCKDFYDTSPKMKVRILKFVIIFLIKRATILRTIANT